MSNIVNKLDTLIELIRLRESEVSNLLPGLTREEIERKTKDFPFDLPEEIYQLYQWRNGISIDSDREIPFIFRDHYLSNLDDAVKNYYMWMEAKIEEGLVEKYSHIIDWEKCFPFAELDDSLLLIICGNHRVIKKYKNPILAFHEDIGIDYYSFEKMLDTCIEWNQQSFERYGVPDNEQEIWEKHNPGIFGIDILQLM